MNGNADRDQKTWQRIEQLFKLREKLQRDTRAGNLLFDTIKIDEVESNLYEALVPQVRAIMYSFAQVHWPENVRKEVVNEAIHRVFQAYAGFQGKARLRTYCTTVIKNVVLGYLKKQRPEQNWVSLGEEEIARLVDQRALDQFNEKEKSQRPEDLVTGSAGRLLEALDFKALGLTDKEFVAVVLKLASKCLLRQKLTDEELARMLGLKRVTFVDAYLRGRDKIYRHLKEKQKIESE